MIAPLLLALLPLLPQDPPAATQGPEPPDDAIPMLLEGAGGIETWRGISGVRYDLLETRRYLDRDERPPRWKVETYLPVLQHLDPRGNGYALCEYVNKEATAPTYRRVIFSEGAAWAEQDGGWVRVLLAAEQASLRMRREFFLGLFPFSLTELGATSSYVRTDPIGPPEEGRSVWVYRLELREAIRMQREERVREFLVYVDPETRRAVELRFRFTGEDRFSPGASESWARVHFIGDVAVAGILLPHKRAFKYDDSVARTEWWLEDARAEAVPAEALRRPWHTGTIWEWTDRADFWDPPAEGVPKGAGDEGPEDRGGVGRGGGG